MKLSIDIEVSDEAEATRMMIYHLKLACAYFECTHKELEPAYALIKKSVAADWRGACVAFVQEINEAYEAMYA